MIYEVILNSVLNTKLASTAVDMRLSSLAQLCTCV